MTLATCCYVVHGPGGWVHQTWACARRDGGCGEGKAGNRDAFCFVARHVRTCCWYECVSSGVNGFGRGVGAAGKETAAPTVGRMAEWICACSSGSCGKCVDAPGCCMGPRGGG